MGLASTGAHIRARMWRSAAKGLPRRRLPTVACDRQGRKASWSCIAVASEAAVATNRKQRHKDKIKDGTLEPQLLRGAAVTAALPGCRMRPTGSARDRQKGCRAGGGGAGWHRLGGARAPRRPQPQGGPSIPRVAAHHRSGAWSGSAAGLLDKRRRRLPTVAQKPSGGRRAPRRRASARRRGRAAPAGGREDSSAAASAEVVGASSELSTIVLRFAL